METRLNRLWRKLADATRALVGWILDAETFWGLFVTFGLPAGLLGILRTTLHWWTRQDVVSQILLGISFGSLLLAVGIGLWNTVGQRILRWFQARAFPAVVIPQINDDEVHLAVRSRRSSDEFKASLVKAPGTSERPLPTTLVWRETGEGTCRIFGRDREDLLFLRCRFQPPGASGKYPVFYWVIPTDEGESVTGAIPLAAKDEHGFWFADLTFHVSVAGWKLGLIDVFDVRFRPRWDPTTGFNGQLQVGVDPAPGPGFLGGFQAAKNYVPDSEITELTEEFRGIDRWVIPPGALFGG